MIRNFEDFVSALHNAGFSMSGAMGDGTGNGIYSVINWGWNDSPPHDSPIRWHTGDPDTDPWEWRMRVLEERDDIAYAKLFFNKGGFITKEWYPYFLAARRGGDTFEEAYENGTISHFAKRIYDVIKECNAIPSHEIKQAAGFTREDKSKFDRALTELQMKMFITICGRKQKTSKTGEEYGWSSTAFCIADNFFGSDVIKKAAQIDAQEAFDKIKQQVVKLNPSATEAKIKKFIKG